MRRKVSKPVSLRESKPYTVTDKNLKQETKGAYAAHTVLIFSYQKQGRT